MAAVQAVLPAMRERGTDSVLVTAGIGSVNPVRRFGALNAAQAATRHWVLNLHGALQDSGVFVAHVAVGVAIGAAAPAPGYPFRTPDQLAEAYWDLHLPRETSELVVTD